MPVKPIPETMWSAEDAARFLKCKPITIRRMIARGELKAVRYGRLIRINPADVQSAGKPVRAYQPSSDFLADLGGDAA